MGFVPLLASLHDQQRRFYETQGARAFGAHAVPWRITTGHAMAQLVVRAAEAFANARGLPTVQVVELGSGLGRLACYCLESSSRLRWLATDLAPQTVAQWPAHPRLASLLSSGRLTTAAGDGLDAEWLAGQISGPSVVVATYLFDSLPHAVVEFTAEGPQEVGTLNDVAVLRPWAGPVLPAMPVGQRFLVPTGALQLLQTLARVAPQAVLLTADKGPLCWMSTGVDVAAHGAEVSSVSVNFAFLKDQGWPHAVWPGSSDAFSVHVVAPGGASLSFLSEVSDCQLPTEALKQVLAVDSLSAALQLHPSADTLMQLADLLREKAVQAQGAEGEPLIRWVNAAADDAFDVQGDDVLFHAATVLQRAGALEAACEWYRRSLARHGTSVAALMNLAGASVGFGDFAGARQALKQLLAIDPTHERAQAFLLALPVG